MKNRICTNNFFFFSILLSFFINLNASGQLLTVSVKKIINRINNQEVVLNSMDFGNWMVMEGYMMNTINQAPDQHTWKQKLTTLIGSANTSTFYNAWVSNFVRLMDIQQIKAWGFNVVRLPIHYEYFINADLPDVWNPQGFTILNNIISWCSSESIYVIVDLSGAPSGQSANNICDYDSKKTSLWESTANKTKTFELWKKYQKHTKMNIELQAMIY